MEEGAESTLEESAIEENDAETREQSRVDEDDEEVRQEATTPSPEGRDRKTRHRTLRCTDAGAGGGVGWQFCSRTDLIQKSEKWWRHGNAGFPEY